MATCISICAFGILLSSVAPQRRQPAPEYWTLTRISADGADTAAFHLRLEWHADSILGSVEGSTHEIRGSVGVTAVEFLQRDSAGALLRRYTGRRLGRDSMVGTWTVATGRADNAAWSAVREASSAPRHVHYEPPASQLPRGLWSGGQGAYSAFVPTGVRVNSGDTVTTRSRDANADAPIWVNGALPGDVLAIKILKIIPIGSAYGGRRLMDQWLLPDYWRTAGSVSAPPINYEWRLDTIAGVATLLQPSGQLAGFTIPLRPMLGAIGVAPRVSQPWREEGEWGGNLDYNRIRVGATLPLPVFTRGAYLYIGSDAHAAQGDGELASQALEMEADVVFTVEVIRGAALSQTWVRAEDADDFMAFGSAGDMRVAVQRATTNLATWLQRSYCLTPPEIATVLGSSVRLDIANLYGEQLTVVARLSRSIVGQFKVPAKGPCT
jgi:amidase